MSPTFSIVSNEEYIAKLSKNSSERIHVLPPQFIVSLSYRPTNNTVLNLLSISENTSTSVPDSQVSSSAGTNIAAEPPQLYSSLMLSSTITHVQPDSFRDLWSNLSYAYHHSLTFIVISGQLYACLDEEFGPAEPSDVTLWKPNSTQESLQLVFSSHLHSVASVVSYIHLSCITILFYYVVFLLGDPVWSESSTSSWQHTTFKWSLFTHLPFL